MHTPETLIRQLQQQPESVQFAQVMAIIEANCNYFPTGFSNGDSNSRIVNRAGENEGSCKLFAFAQLLGLGVQQTLHCFGDYYRKDVLLQPDGENHANIRQFMITGWKGISFDRAPLKMKKPGNANTGNANTADTQE